VNLTYLLLIELVAKNGPIDIVLTTSDGRVYIPNYSLLVGENTRHQEFQSRTLRRESKYEKICYNMNLKKLKGWVTLGNLSRPRISMIGQGARSPVAKMDFSYYDFWYPKARVKAADEIYIQ